MILYIGRGREVGISKANNYKHIRRSKSITQESPHATVVILPKSTANDNRIKKSLLRILNVTKTVSAGGIYI